MTTYFDTLKLATRLEAGGFSTQQARAMAEALGDGAVVADLASKVDLQAMELRLEGKIAEVETRLDARISEVETRLDARITEVETRLDGKITELGLLLTGKLAETKADMLKWMYGAIGFQTLVTIGAVVALARLMKP